MRFFEQCKGSISIFLILVLFPLYSCIYLAIDSLRYEAARAKLYSAVNLTGNGALNNYDLTLKETYGLFAMSEETEAAEAALSALFTGTLEGEREVAENYIVPAASALSLSFVPDSALANPDALEQAVTDYMKYRAPYAFAGGLSRRLSAFTDLPEISSVLKKSEDYYDELGKIDDDLSSLGSSVLNTKSEETEREALEKGVNKLKSSLSGIRSEEQAWKEALDAVENEDTKSLLSGDYQSSADLLSEEHIEQFLALLQEPEEGDAEETVPAYREDPLYQYILSSAESAVSKEEKEEAGAVKKALETVKNTELSAFLSGCPEVNVSELLGSAASGLNAWGTEEASSVSVTAGETSSLFAGASSFFDDFSTALLQQAFTEEYVSSMFSCYTTTETATNGAGVSFSNFPLFRGEQEYILFGKENSKANVEQALTLMFAVRFLLNSLYAFSNAKMRSEAMSVAAGIAGWTGIGITVAQNLILVLWSMGESVLDVSALSKGQSVPIYKNANTWTLSLRGASEAVKNGVTQYAGKEIDNIFDRLEAYADGTLENVTGEVKDYLNQTGSGAAESVANAVMAPIQNKMSAILGNAAFSGYSREQVRQLLLDAVSSSSSDSEAYKAALTVFESSLLDPLTDQIYANYEYLFSEEEGLSAAAAETVQNAISDVYGSLYTQVEQQMDGFADAAMEKVNASLEEGREKVKENTLSAIEEYMGQLNGYLGDGDTKGDAVSGYSGFSMSYQDYLKVFYFVLSSGEQGKQDLLLRTAKVMQINCAVKDPSFLLTGCFRAVTLTGSARIGSRTIKKEEVYQY